MAFAGIRICDIDDPVDEIHTSGRDRYARTAGAAKDDDVFYAYHDAMGDVVGTVGAFAILVLR